MVSWENFAFIVKEFGKTFGKDQTRERKKKKGKRTNTFSFLRPYDFNNAGAPE